MSPTESRSLLHRRCDQPRVIDLTAPGARRLEAVPGFILEEVLERVKSILEAN